MNDHSVKDNKLIFLKTKKSCHIKYHVHETHFEKLQVQQRNKICIFLTINYI